MNLFEFADKHIWMMAVYLIIIGYSLSLCFRKKYPDSPWVIGMKLIIMVVPFIRQFIKSKAQSKKDNKNG